MNSTRVTLLQRIRDWNDTKAWREFDALYRPLLLRYAQASGLDTAEAEEIAQQCLTGIAEHISRFEYDPQKGAFRGWLRTLVKNNIRKRFRGPRAVQADARVMDEAGPEQESPDALFEQVWLEEHLRFCLERIRPEVEEQTYCAFELHVLQEQPVQQVCKTLEITANQVYKAKWRITRKLEETMSSLVGDSESRAGPARRSVTKP